MKALTCARLFAQIMASTNKQTDESLCRAQQDSMCAVAKGVPKESTYAMCEPTTYCSNLKSVYENKQCSTDADCPLANGGTEGPGMGEFMEDLSCCSSAMKMYKEVCDDVKATEEDLAVSSSIRTHQCARGILLWHPAIACWRLSDP